MSLTGAKGGSSTFKQRADNLRSNDTFEGLLVLCGGPILGPVNGLKSQKINGTPIEDASGTANFQDVVMVTADGDPAKFPQIATLKLGAGAAPVSVNLPVGNTNGAGTPGPWVVKTINNTNADSLDLRFIVSQLVRQDKKGIYEATANLEIELKPTGFTNWINPNLAVPSGTYSPLGQALLGRYGSELTGYFEESNYSGINNSWSPETNNGYLGITGKTSSPYVHELRIDVPNTGVYANKSWDVRVRLREVESVDADPNYEKRIIQWESIAAVYASDVGNHEDWRGVAWAQIFGKASDQFNGAPEIEGDYFTKIVSVPPSNVFNPTTRQYTATTWDGSFSKSYTNDPAWVINDALSDSIFGLSNLAPGAHLNKWDALEISKYCSALVSDGDGGTHPRFSLNLKVTEPQKADEFIQYLAGAVSGFAWDNGSGEWRMKLDKPEIPSDILTLETIEGEFSYAHSDIDTRFNDITMSFLNEEMDFREDRVRVFDQDHINTYGRKPTTVVAVGCTNRQEALRRATLRLRSSVNEFRMVSYVTNRRGRLVQPFDTVLIADGDLGYKLPGGIGAANPADGDATNNRTTGRVLSLNGARTTLTLRDSVRVEIGVTYIVHFSVPNPAYSPNPTTQPTDPSWSMPTVTISRTLTNTSGQRGDVTTLYLDAALPANIPEYANFALEASGLPSIPKTYRILDVKPNEDGEHVAITAIEVDTGKYAAADAAVATAFSYTAPDVVVPTPLPPVAGNLLSLVTIPGEGANRVNLIVNWQRPPSLFLNGFSIRYRVNDGPFIDAVAGIQDTSWEMVDPSAGTYFFEIRAHDRREASSLPLTGSLVVTSAMLAELAANAAAAAAAVATANTAAQVAGAAQVDADAALAGITVITNDGILDKAEKPDAVQRYNAIVAETAGITAQATAFSIVTERDAYTAALDGASGLTAYLTALVPSWSDYTTDTPIVRATFNSKFVSLYTARQTLLNKIAAVAKARGDLGVSDAAAALVIAQDADTAADNAQASANTAMLKLADIASDGLLTPDEKPRVIQDRDVILAEQAGIEARATGYTITTEKFEYTAAIGALTTYLATLTTPVLWSNLAGNTTIVGTTFRDAFKDVYFRRQVLLNKIDEIAGQRATWAGTADRPPLLTGESNTVDEFLRDPSAWVYGNGVFTTGFDGEGSFVGNAGQNPYIYHHPNNMTPIDPNATYEVEMEVFEDGTLDAVGAGVMYLGLRLVDGIGNEISGDGSFWRYYRAYQGLPTKGRWHKYSDRIGRGTNYPFPANATKFGALALLNYTNVAGVVHRVRRMKSRRIADQSWTSGDPARYTLGDGRIILGEQKFPADWGNTAFTRAFIKGPQRLTFRFAGNSARVLAGLSEQQSPGIWSQAALSVFLPEEAGTIQLYDNLGQVFIAPNDGNRLSVEFAIEYDGLTLKAYKNGVPYGYSKFVGPNKSYTAFVDTPYANTGITGATHASTQSLSVIGSNTFDSAGTAWIAANNATADTRLIVRGTGLLLEGNRAHRQGGDQGWTADCYSVDGFTGGAYCSFVGGSDTAHGYYMAGLNTDPTTNMDYTSLDYCWYQAQDSNLHIREGGNDMAGNVGPYVLGDVLSISYDGVNVRYYHNGTLKRTVAAPANLKLHFDSSIVIGEIRNISFGPLTNNDFATTGGATKPQNNATNDTFQDTRNDNQPSSWYFANYAYRTAHEFKDGWYLGVLGVPAPGYYGSLITRVDYQDASGGPVKQEYTVGTGYAPSGLTVGAKFIRYSTGASTWSPWAKDFSALQPPRLGVSGELLTEGGAALTDSAVRNSLQIWNEVNNKPVELTDGRIPAGIGSDGRNIIGIRAGAGLPPVTNVDVLAGVSGTQLNPNPEFTGATSAGYSLYDNSGGGHVGLFMEVNSAAPNASGHTLGIYYDGLGISPNNNPSPGYGGATIALLPDGEVRRPGTYAKGTTIIYKIWAKIPVGRSINWASNATGAESTFAWLTSQAGSGDWSLYIARQYIGVTGSFSSTGFLYVDGGSNVSFSWYIAKYDAIDVTSAPRSFLGRGGLLDEDGGTLFKGNVRNDQMRIIEDAGGTGGRSRFNLRYNAGAETAHTFEPSAALQNIDQLWSDVDGAGRPEDYSTASDNMVVNGNFTGGTVGWTPNGSVTPYTEAAGNVVGTGVYFGANVIGEVRGNNGVPVPINGATKIYASGHTWGSVAGYFRAGMLCYNSAGAFLNYVDLDITPDILGQYRPFLVAITPVAGTTHIVPYIYSAATAAVNYVSNLRFAKTEPAATVGARSGINLRDSSGTLLVDTAVRNADQLWAEVNGTGRPEDNSTKGSNRLYNGDATAGLSGWVVTTADGGGAFSTSIPSLAIGGASSFVLSKTASGIGHVTITSKPIQVVPGQKLFIRMKVYGSTTTANGLYLRIGERGQGPEPTDFTGHAGQFSFFLENGPVDAANVVAYEYPYTVPAGVNWIAMSILNWVAGPATVIVDDLYIGENQLGATEGARSGINLRDSGGNLLVDTAVRNSDQTWAQVSGTGRPADNATVGATAGVNLRKEDTSIVADIDIMNAREQGGVLTLPSVGGGSLNPGSSVSYGMLKVRLPSGVDNTMLKFFIDVYEYNADTSVRYEVAGYLYGTYWINMTANASGKAGAIRPVHFGKDADGYFCVWIGETGSSWSYPGVTIQNFQAHYSNFAASQWKQGWQITFTQTARFSTTQTVNQPNAGDALVGVNTRRGNNLALLGGVDLLNENIGVDAGIFKNTVGPGHNYEVGNEKVRVNVDLGGTGGRARVRQFRADGAVLLNEVQLPNIVQNLDQQFDQVVPGFGRPANNATADTRLIVRGTGLLLEGNRAYRPTGGGAWDSDCYSVGGYTGGAQCSFIMSSETTVSYCMAGLNTDPTQDTSYTSIDYCWFAENGNLHIYESGSSPVSFGAIHAVGDVFGVTYDGINVRYYHNGELKRTVAAAANLKFHFDSSIVAGEIRNISFGAMSNNEFASIGGATKPEDMADVTSYVVGASQVTIEADSNGVAVAALLPKVVAYKLMKNASDLTTSATWSRTVLSGNAATTVSAGALSITNLTSDEAVVRVTAVLGLITRVLDIKLLKNTAPAAPPSGGGTTVNVSSFQAVNSTSPIVMTVDMEITVGSAGTATLSAPLSFEATSSVGSFGINLRWQRWNGSAWVDIGTVASATQNANRTVEEGVTYSDPGSVSAAETVTGLSGAQKFRLTGYTPSGTVTRIFSGTAIATGS